MKLMNNVSKEEKKLIRKMFWRSGAMYASVNPVTMGGGGFCYSMIPFINHFYKDNEEKRREALARHVKSATSRWPLWGPWPESAIPYSGAYGVLLQPDLQSDLPMQETCLHH